MIFNLIRHAKTKANEKHLYCGDTDISISDEGIQELMKLKNQNIYQNAEICIISNKLRTLQTAQILFDFNIFIIIKDLREICFGEFEMYSHEDLKNKSSYKKWISDIENNAPFGGESKTEFTRRVMNSFCEVKSMCKFNSIRSAIIVTHAGVIATIMKNIFYENKYKNKNFYEWKPSYGRGYCLIFDDFDNVKYRNI